MLHEMVAVSVGHPLRALLVEDSADDAALLLHELRRGGYEPAWERVETADGLVAALARQDWDIIICDWVLPRLTAPAALALIRQHATLRGLDIPAIVVSGEVGEECAVTAMKAGAYDFVTKHKLARLVPAVERELREAAGRRAHTRAEEALARSRARLQTYIEQANDLIFTLDAAGTFTSVNRAVCETTGYAAEDILGKSPLEFVAPESRERVAHTLRRALDEEVVDPVESTVIRKDGRLVTLQVRGRHVADGNLPAEIFLIGRDVTQERQAEVLARQTQKLEAVGRLAGGVAHDFNNQLTIVKGYAQFLLSSTAPNDPNRRDIESICETVDRGARLVHQLLTFSRLEPLAPQPLNLSELIDGMAPMLRLLLGEQIALRLNTAPGLWSVLGDRSQIEQVVMNLVSNARDAMSPHGELLSGDTVTIETRNLRPEESLTDLPGDIRPGPYVLLTASDNGPGMSPKVQEHMFEPFFTTKEFGKGTGLGLATVYGVVKQHHGYVSCTSEVGHGTTFQIYFPRNESAVRTTPVEVTPAEQPGHLCQREQTVLVAEDEANVREVVVRALEESGYRVCSAARPDEALSLAARIGGQVDLLVTDIVMPGGSGHRLAHRLRQLYPNLRVLFISGYGADTYAAPELPGARFLQKPFGLDELLGHIRDILAEA